ncbi:TetR/AcrR family transcriptional regulator [Pantoea phytobeneficialis]|uniref:TetR family transcriptional regulator n=1 Tax=Pantoea phytobeneficialis TaxID=2052056 RepID=A0AAP9HBI1_9GAMM|nr:TetR/AcrR family transcriptional regulator [Pantoea phytobeneficialis]MDO6409887.1 TetR/AcrR family transcriptional regulator [Pantoea phytobeneficialis]QGR09759.1 TetR family transcriptional regulator [Pantoea phytobeneficialis]
MATMGRPRTFDRDKAIEDAMFLFWQHGYESTSLAQLKAGINNGISAPSFYAAFGSKEALFRECVQRYIATYAQVTEFLWDNNLSARDALETTLRRSAKMQCEPGHPSGCMVGLGAMSAPSAENAAVAEPLERSRNRTRAGVVATIERGVATEQLNKSVDVKALAAMFSTFLFGISIQARDGASLDELNKAITQMMWLWDSNKQNED